MSLGLERAGFTPLLAFDANEKAVETHRRNLPGPCWHADVREVSGPQILEFINMDVGELPLLSGGPPCQGFSKQKRGAHLGDQRNDLVLQFLRLIQELRPQVFLFENVAIFGQKRGKKYVREFEKRLVDYRFYSHFYNGADYGLAQTVSRQLNSDTKGL